ncbi:MAG: hypothetical protein ABR573_01715, partial [Candidatus Dormibacteria bacterium]
MGSSQTVNAVAGASYTLVDCGGADKVTPPCTVTGNMSGTGTATVAAETQTVCFYETKSADTETGTVAGVIHLCEDGQQTAGPGPGTITIGAVSGASPQTASGLPMGSSQTVNAVAGTGYALVDCGGTNKVTPPCTVTGNMNGTGAATVAAETQTVCFYEAKVKGSDLSIVKQVDHTQVVAPAPLTYTITVSNSGDAVADHVAVVDVITPGTVQFDAPAHFYPSSGTVLNSNGHYFWTIPSIAAGSTATLKFTVIARTAGTIANASVIGVPGDNCLAPTCSQVQTVVTQPAASTITAVIYKEGTTTVVPGGTVQLQDVSQPTGNYKATYSNLPAGQYCVQETTPSGWNLVGSNLPMTGTPGQVCTEVAAGQQADVIYYVSQAPSACVGEEYMLQGTTIVIPGGSVTLTGQSPQSAPYTYCNLPVGSVTGTAVTAPTGYLLVPGTSPQSEDLHAGNNPTIIFYVNIPQPGSDCGEVLGTIVLAGTTTMVPGGTITEGGQAAVTSYPALLGPCVAAGELPVTATVPPGYTFVGPGSTTVTVKAGAVTPVVFQVTPIAGGVEGAHSPAQGVEAASVQHAPMSGVLGTSIGMPLTGSEAQGRLALSMVCVALGIFALLMNRRNSRQA